MEEKRFDLEKREVLASVGNNDLEELNRLLEKNCSVNVQDYDGRTPLHVAASENKFEIVKRLMMVHDIEMNHVDNFELTPYHDALIHKNIEIAEYLFERGCTVVHRELGYVMCDAASKGNINELKLHYDSNYKKKNKANDLNTTDYDLRSALHLAVCEN